MILYIILFFAFVIPLVTGYFFSKLFNRILKRRLSNYATAIRLIIFIAVTTLSYWIECFFLFTGKGLGGC